MSLTGMLHSTYLLLGYHLSEGLYDSYTNQYGVPFFIPSFTGGTKKGTDHIIQSVKHVKSTGAILSMNIDPSSMHLAVGSDQGHVR